MSKPRNDDRFRGLGFDKFYVSRVDGRSAPGEKHHGCRHFVVDVDHDPYARAALAAYAAACAAEYPILARDLRRLAGPFHVWTWRLTRAFWFACWTVTLAGAAVAAAGVFAALFRVLLALAGGLRTLLHAEV